MGRLFRRRHQPLPHAGIAQLTKSRRIIVEAYEVERRRIERDLHDGAQQYLVAAALALGQVLDACPSDLEDDLAAVQVNIDRAIRALRATVHGIHPQVLTDLGLMAALTDLTTTMPGVSLRCPRPLPTLPEGVLATAYFFVTEAVTNARKYAPDAPVSILVTADQDLRISVVDSGPGGARVVPGGGLEGMAERVAAVGGAMSVTSPVGGPTQIIMQIPLLLYPGEPSIPLEKGPHHARRLSR